MYITINGTAALYEEVHKTMVNTHYYKCGEKLCVHISFSPVGSFGRASETAR